MPSLEPSTGAWRRLPRWVFRIAGIYGIVVVTPMFFLERGLAPGAVHPVFFYGWVSATLAWQLLFVAVSRDPVRFRPVMPVCVLEKLAAVIAIPWLFVAHRVGRVWLRPAAVDLAFAALFVVAYRALGQSSTGHGA